MQYRESQSSGRAGLRGTSAQATNSTTAPESFPEPPKSSRDHSKKSRSKLSLLKWVVAAALVVALLVVSWNFVNTKILGGGLIDSGRYQAVFFTNGQVYFGKLETVNDEYMKLKDVFYIQAKSTDTTDGKNPQETSVDTSNDIQLIKLGSEVHGPDDQMIISKDQVLFFENLKSDGTVSKSITQYKSSQDN